MKNHGIKYHVSERPKRVSVENSSAIREDAYSG